MSQAIIDDLFEIIKKKTETLNYYNQCNILKKLKEEITKLGIKYESDDIYEKWKEKINNDSVFDFGGNLYDANWSVKNELGELSKKMEINNYFNDGHDITLDIIIDGNAITICYDTSYECTKKLYIDNVLIDNSGNKPFKKFYEKLWLRCTIDELYDYIYEKFIM